jgi:hypothetical protein
VHAGADMVYPEHEFPLASITCAAAHYCAEIAFGAHARMAAELGSKQNSINNLLSTELVAILKQ